MTNLSMTADPQGKHTNIRIYRYLIFLETRIIGLHFAADNISLSSLKFLSWAPEILFISASVAFWSFKVIIEVNFGANRKRVCDFLVPISPQ